MRVSAVPAFVSRVYGKPKALDFERWYSDFTYTE
jgi:hypothetical protein